MALTTTPPQGPRTPISPIDPLNTAYVGTPSPTPRAPIPVPFRGLASPVAATTSPGVGSTSPTITGRFVTLHTFGIFTPAPAPFTSRVSQLQGRSSSASPNQPFHSPIGNKTPANPGLSPLAATPTSISTAHLEASPLTPTAQPHTNHEASPASSLSEMGDTPPAVAQVTQVAAAILTPRTGRISPSSLFPGLTHTTFPQTPPTGTPLVSRVTSPNRAASPVEGATANPNSLSPSLSSLSVRTTPSPDPNSDPSTDPELLNSFAEPSPPPSTPPRTPPPAIAFPFAGLLQTPAAQIIRPYFAMRGPIVPFAGTTRYSPEGLPLPTTGSFGEEELPITPPSSPVRETNPAPSTTTSPHTPTNPDEATPQYAMPATPRKERKG